MLRFGKKQEDNKDKDGEETSTRWLVRVIWTLSRDSVNLAEIVHETEIVPPYVVRNLPMSSGSTCRPAWWDEANHDWRILEDSDWDPTRERLSFELPGAGVLVPVSGRTGWTSTGTVSSGGAR